jgi:hypothetical protein
MLALQNAPDDRHPSLFQTGNKLGILLHVDILSLIILTPKGIARTLRVIIKPFRHKADGRLRGPVPSRTAQVIVFIQTVIIDCLNKIRRNFFR